VSKKSRDKGQRGERILAKKFSEWWGSDFTRTPSSGGFRTKEFRDDWNAAGDLVTPDETFPFCVESKNAEGWHLEQLLTSSKCAIVQWWKQTVDETPKGKIPLLVFTRNHQPHFFMMFLTDWSEVTSFRSDVHECPTFMMYGRIVKIGLLETLFKIPPKD
jgi:hypothetical protein